VSMIMVIAALVALIVARVFGRRKSILSGGPV
jgi:hypothetical protein